MEQAQIHDSASACAAQVGTGHAVAIKVEGLSLNGGEAFFYPNAHKAVFFFIFAGCGIILIYGVSV